MDRMVGAVTSLRIELILLPGPLSNSAAASLRRSLSSAQSSFKTPHPPPPPSVSLASALFSSSSPLFTSSASPNQSTDVTNTSPADPTAAADAKNASPSTDNDLAAALARTLEIPLGLKLEKASLRWSGWESTTSFAGSDAAPEGGYEELVGKVLAQAEKKGAEVHLNTVIKEFKLEEDSISVSTANGDRYTAKTAICTLPLGALKMFSKSAFEPPLPPRMLESIEGTHVGILEKLLLHYPSPWWPDAEKVGSYTFLPTAPTPNESSTLDEIFAGTTLVCANFSCPALPNSNSTLLTYLSETPATLLLRNRPDEVAMAYHKFLISRFKPSSTPPEPLEYNLTNWLTDPFSYGATTTPSIISDNGERSPMDFKELGRPVWDGRLGFAGEHTEMEHRGSVAGAVVSGQREAERVGRFLKEEGGG